MISKSEFVFRVKTEIFPTLDEKKFQRLKFWRNISLVLFVFVLLAVGCKVDLTGEYVEVVVFFTFLFPGPICIFFDRFGNEKRMQTKKALFKMLDLPQIDFCGFSLENEDCLSEKGLEVTQEKHRFIRASTLFKQNVEKAVSFFENALPFNSEMACFETVIRSIPGGRNHNTFFKGLFIEIKQNQFYKEPIVFVKKGIFNSRKGLKKVQLRVSDKYFDIYSNDVLKAQSLYHQQVASKLLRIKDDFKVSKVEASFYQDKLFIALYTNKNLFEPIKKKFLDVKQYEQFYDEIAEIENYCKQFTEL